ncbi:phosphatase PAP2 family protein [Neobacillus sp. WH10]|uniref:phosphatase PAP2 family protein n=1 Tax=Neobacillus sp. WH10 TaxID=3047873 RepID=UPI0024C0F0B5|nr:phosphatase PAP2 family protein [Neobacillus sp. WH10]WHY78253.1 phosphatase PAP2 family protein [Neobacillus sp. WH10]
MMRWIHAFYGFECRVLLQVNRHFDKKLLNLFFRTVTHLGGADITIAATFLLILLSSGEPKLTAIASALALSASHIPVQIIKQLFPRKRPYLMIEKTKFPANPLQDHSFPSGHTTAIFSVVTPYVLFNPQLAFVLIPLGVCVGISRIYLGLHYPSDVLAGGILGTITGIVCFCLLCL